MTQSNGADGGGIESKVRVPASVVSAVGALLALLGVLGVDVPIDSSTILEAIGAVMFLTSLVQGLIGWFVLERNPSASTIEAVRTRL